jgi:predicted RNA-binding protein (virulence factor B family)
MYDEEGRVTISRAPVGRAGWSDAEEKLLDILEVNDGFLPLNDKSSPVAISAKTGLSKKSFKKIVGGLMKRGMLEITDAGIMVIED